MQKEATFILIAAVAIYRHIPTKCVFCIFFSSAPESAKVYLPILYCSMRLGKGRFQLLPRPFGLGDESGLSASSTVPFVNVAIFPYACSTDQAF